MSGSVFYSTNPFTPLALSAHYPRAGRDIALLLQLTTVRPLEFLTPCNSFASTQAVVKLCLVGCCFRCQPAADPHVGETVGWDREWRGAAVSHVSRRDGVLACWALPLSDMDLRSLWTWTSECPI